jgi:protein-tyrosine phosphatase
MNEIQSGKLWIGNALDVREPQQLFDVGIRAVVDLAYEESPAQLPREFVYCRFPIVDAGGNDPEVLALAVETVKNLLEVDVPTLVGCSAGMSRSPLIAAFALSQYRKCRPDEAIQEIAAIRSLELNDQLWGQLTRIVPTK